MSNYNSECLILEESSSFVPEPQYGYEFFNPDKIGVGYYTVSQCFKRNRFAIADIEVHDFHNLCESVTLSFNGFEHEIVSMNKDENDGHKFYRVEGFTKGSPMLVCAMAFCETYLTIIVRNDLPWKPIIVKWKSINYPPNFDYDIIPFDYKCIVKSEDIIFRCSYAGRYLKIEQITLLKEHYIVLYNRGVKIFHQNGKNHILIYKQHRKYLLSEYDNWIAYLLDNFI